MFSSRLETTTQATQTYAIEFRTEDRSSPTGERWTLYGMPGDAPQTWTDKADIATFVARMKARGVVKVYRIVTINK